MTTENNEMQALHFDDEKAIYGLLTNLRNAWAKGDGESYAAIFTEDAHYVEAPGNWVQGRKVIAERHQRIFDTFFKNTRIDGKYTTTLQPITSDVVLVHGQGTVLFKGESEKDADPNGIMTLCIVKRNQQWQIASFQNTPTGKWRKIKFIWRFFKSKLFSS
ncbi:MAG TPA: SgcJ/EcaC family oxidoreductase [Mucilaginibacter sp.]|jgi:uncharacterized protein (TIGR02246 family)